VKSDAASLTPDSSPPLWGDPSSPPVYKLCCSCHDAWRHLSGPYCRECRDERNAERRKLHADLANQRDNPLEMAGWTATPHGRWIDPKSGRSCSTAEAWRVMEARNREAVIASFAGYTPRG
jgi:hypothetical protein